MHSMLIRFFLSFWLIIGITIGAAALAGFYYAERMRDLVENLAGSDMVLEASQVLSTGGRLALADWLREKPGNGVTLYVVDERGRDLLERRLPRRVRALLLRQGGDGHRRPPVDRAPGNLRPARPLPQLVAPDGDVLTFVAAPPRHPYGRWVEEQAVPLFLLVALFVSATVSYLLARTVSRPVQELRDAAVAIADGKLDTRVGGKLPSRRDELGLLARDFNGMASGLQQAAAQQRELSANISHELRSPLARLRVALELARRKTGDVAELARIEAETERLDVLIGQILRYARLDAAESEQPVNASPADIVEEVIDNVRFENEIGEQPGVTITATLPPTDEIPLLRDALTSAVENVLRNAVQHSAPGSTVDVTLRRDGDDWCIAISDAGPGVAAEELGQLFEPFYRTRSARDSDDNAGHGLGLAIAARAMAVHGGSAVARNRDGRGLTVELRLPSAGIA